jgi:hypothetical protein
MAMGFASNAYTNIFGTPLSAAAEAPTSKGEMDDRFPSCNHILPYQYPLLSKPRPVTHAPSDVVLNTDSTTNISFKSRMECELAKAIEEQYLCTNVLFKSLLFTQSRLLWHLKGMAEFYFMMQGEVMHSFSTIIFRKVRSIELTARFVVL